MARQRYKQKLRNKLLSGIISSERGGNRGTGVLKTGLFFWPPFSVHAPAVVLVGVFSQHLQCAVFVEDGDGGVGDAVEHIGFHGGVVNHVLKDDALPRAQLVVELP